MVRRNLALALCVAVTLLAAGCRPSPRYEGPLRHATVSSGRHSIPVVPVRHARAMVRAIRAEGGTHIRYTEYPGVGHDCWDRTYSDPRVMAWLLSQRRAR